MILNDLSPGHGPGTSRIFGENGAAKLPSVTGQTYPLAINVHQLYPWDMFGVHM